MERTVSSVFNDRPEQWGLRGDPHLWDDLEQYFISFSPPYTEDEFIEEIHKAFQELTGYQLVPEESVYVSRYSHGGMSSGMICPQFWLNTAIPLLKARLVKLNNHYKK